MSKHWILVFLFLFICSSGKSETLHDAWQSRVMYSILIDRFFDGNNANNPDIDKSNIEGFHGGDIKGIIEKLDYLQELGINGLCVSSFVKNREDPFYDQEPYHGYWPYNFFESDPRFGTEKDLKDLSKALKNKSIAFLSDMSVNHMGYDAPFVKLHPDWFNPNLEIEDWNDPYQLVNRSLYGLPDFASNKLIVKAYFRQVSKHWLRLLRPDGYRLDAVKHVSRDFWNYFNQNAKKDSNKPDRFMLLGDYFSGDPEETAHIWKTGHFDAMYDYPLYYTMKEVFAEEDDCRKLASRFYFDRHYPDAGLLATFLDNQNSDRFFSSCGEDMSKYKLALSFLMTARGIPVLFYGDEVPLTGTYGRKPNNRKSMVFKEKNDLFDYVKELISLRKKYEALYKGIQCYIHADRETFMFGRLTPNQLALVALNNSNKPAAIEAPFPFKIQNNVFVLKPVYGCDCELVLLNDRVHLSLPPKSLAVFVPYSQEDFYSVEYNDRIKFMENEKHYGMVNVTIRTYIEYLPDDADMFLTGNCSELGNWSSTGRAIPMKDVGGNHFEATVSLPAEKIIECKCFYRHYGKTVWQDTGNSVFHISPAGSEYLFIEWRNLK